MEYIKSSPSPVLSISLLVSDRIDTIRRCMESLKPLMEAIPAELIAVDTGGTDGSIDIVKEYTHKIVSFSWCNDFAAARNAGLKEARGEWFLFLDDDEWFEDTGEIVEFFLSGEYRNYQSAQYLVRNYSVDGGSADAYVSRVCALTPEMHFTGSIHEYLTPIQGPIKYFHAYVHHYGYCYKTEEEKQSHFQRNVTLLKNELRKNPRNVRYLCQLAQEYETVNDLENEESICRLALNNSGASSTSITGINWIMAALIRILSAQGKYKEALKEGKKLISKKQPYELSRAIILAHMAEDAVLTGEFSDALAYVGEYIDLVRSLNENPEMASVQSMLTMTISYVKELYGILMANGLESCCGSEDFTMVTFFLEWLFNNEKDADMSQACALAERLKEKYPKAKLKLISAMACLENPEQHPYLLLQQLLAGDGKNMEELQELYDRCIQQCLKQQKFYGSLLCAAGENGLKHTFMLEQFNRNEWEDWLSASLPSLTDSSLDSIKKSLDMEPKTDSLKQLSFLVTLERQILLRYTGKKEDIEYPGDAYLTALHDYCEDGLVYFKRLYRPEVFTDEKGENLPKECRYLNYLKEAFELENRGDIPECLKKVKAAIRVNPPMAETLSRYLDYVGKQAAVTGNDEFLSLGKKIKEQARALMEEDKYMEAAAVLKQLEQLMPDDIEIRRMIRKASVYL